MNKLNNDIRKAFADENEGMFYNLDREQGVCEMIAETFHGKMRWMTILAWTEGVVFTCVAVFVAVKFFTVQTVREWILYATLFLTVSMIIVLIKMWCWMAINRTSIQREIKRLELRILELSRHKDNQCPKP
ncbi:MAG: DUF6768 family protein [Planctomycetota bacterium]|nr:DUF6768 family protein [Planctomycetota bacterium]